MSAYMLNTAPTGAKHPECPACTHRRQHTDEQWATYHPQAGWGYVPEHGWLPPELEAIHNAEVQATAGERERKS